MLLTVNISIFSQWNLKMIDYHEWQKMYNGTIKKYANKPKKSVFSSTVPREKIIIFQVFHLTFFVIFVNVTMKNTIMPFLWKSQVKSLCYQNQNSFFLLVLNLAIGLQSSLILRIIIITWKISSERDGMIAWYFEAEAKPRVKYNAITFGMMTFDLTFIWNKKKS